MKRIGIVGPNPKACRVIARDAKTGKSKSCTVYGLTTKELIDLVKDAVKQRAAEESQAA